MAILSTSVGISSRSSILTISFRPYGNLLLVTFIATLTIAFVVPMISSILSTFKAFPAVIWSMTEPFLIDLTRNSSLLFFSVIAVSYTHLRAHETPEHLVCRLLLEQTKLLST